jgi:hypothetical protein
MTRHVSPQLFLGMSLKATRKIQGSLEAVRFEKSQKRNEIRGDGKSCHSIANNSASWASRREVRIFFSLVRRRTENLQRRSRRIRPKR